MTRTRRFIGGLAVGYANQALVTIVGLWLTAFLLARLGQEDYGLWLVGTRILGYLALLDLGVVALLPRETAFATGRAGGERHAHDLPEIVGRTTRLVFWQMPLIALAAAIVWLALPHEWAALRHPLALVMGIFVLGFPLRVFQALLTGLQELAFLGAVFTGTWIVGTAVTVALAFAGFGLYALAIGWSVGQVLAGLLWWRRVVTHHAEAIPSRLSRFSGGMLRDRLSRSMWISMSQIAQVLLQGTDLLIIAKILGPQAVVPYFCTAKVLTVLGNQPQMLAEAAQPALSELRTGPDRARLAEVSLALSRAILILSGAAACVVLAVNEGFVSWWVGRDQYGGAVLTAVLLAAMLLRHWNVTAVYSLFAFGRDRRIAVTTLAEGIVTVTLTVIFVLRWGLLGAAIGSTAGVILVALPANMTAQARELGISTLRLVGNIWPWFWRFGVVATLAVLVSDSWIPTTVPALVAATLLASGAYGALMLPLALRDPLGMYVRPRLETLRRIVLRQPVDTGVDA